MTENAPMFEHTRRNPKTTRAVIPSYTSAIQAMERWMEENHLYTPKDKDGTPWTIRQEISLLPSDHSSLSIHQCDWQIRLWAQTTLSTRHLIEIGVFNKVRDERLIELTQQMKAQIQLKEKVIVALNEPDARKKYVHELPQYVSQIENTTAKEIKKNLFCQLFEKKRVFGSSSEHPEIVRFLESYLVQF